jgi:hypothetical protein
MTRLRPSGFGGQALRPSGFGGQALRPSGFGGQALRPSGSGEAGAQEERIRAVIDCGFTERQARFLVLVMRHGGVCIPRQYASFAGIANGGRQCNAFFEKLVKRGCVHEIRCVHNRARVYHIHHKPLYFLIGEASSRYRRPVSPQVAVERLMLLDAVLAVGVVEWLTTAAEKAAYLAGLKAKATDDRPQLSTSEEARPRPSSPSSALPMAVAADGRTLLPYLASEPTTETFRTFLQTHAELLRVAPTWTIRIVFPRPLDHAHDAYQAVVHEELESPLHPVTISELQSYFELRLEAARGEPMHPLNQGFLRKGHEVFAAARFTAMYHRWLKHREPVFAGPSSHAIAKALNSGRGRVESVLLPHLYRHLAPWLLTRRHDPSQ